MMGRESFILLKAGFLGPKSAKQAERRPDVLPTILSIAGPPLAGSSAKRRKILVSVALLPISAGYG
jgi:hypothetical protein